MRSVIVNGSNSPDGKATIDADDLGITRGLAVFETLRTYRGIPFRVEEHAARLAASLEFFGIEPVAFTIFSEEVARALAPVCAAGHEAMVRITITPSGLRLVRAAPVPPQPGRLRAATATWQVPAGVGATKHCSRAFSYAARARARTDEVIWVDPDGFALEGTRSNVFAVRDGVLCTPPADGRILSGITRGALLDAAELAGIPTSEAPLRLESLDELYFSSTLKELIPISELDDAPAAGQGPVGKAAAEAFAELVDMECGPY